MDGCKKSIFSSITCTLFCRTDVFMTAPKPARKTRAELMKDIDADYYGYRDEDDGRLLPLEKEAEENG